MIKALFLALNLRKEEEKQVLLLLGNGFFMGIFLASYQISAETLFLNRLENYLKEAIMISGFLGIIITALFAYLQTRVAFSKLVLGNLIGIFSFISGVYLLFKLGDPGWQDVLVFLMFAMIGPMLAVSLLGFWGVFGRMFDLRQSKRIIGGIDIGQLSASILISFSIPFLEPLLPNTTSYLLISGVCVLVSLFFLTIITKRYDLKKAEVSSSKSEASKTGVQHLIKNRYVRLLSFFLLFSMVAFTLVQFSFQNVVAQQYPDEGELRNFLAIFNGSILVLSFLLQTFVNDRIIGEYGLKVSLLVLPIILSLLTVGALLAGTLFGYTPDAGTYFIWFFLFIALSRLFNFSLRDSLENPTFKLYFMPLDNRIRFDIQTKVEGVVNEASRFVGGLLIMGLSFISFFSLIHYSYALIFVIIGYFFIIGKLYSEYRDSIRHKLQDQQDSFDEEVLSPQERLFKRLTAALTADKSNKVVFSFKLLEKLDPHNVPRYINSLMGHGAGEIRDFAQNKINEIKGNSISDRYVINMSGSQEQSDKRLVSGTDVLDLFQAGNVTKARLSKLCKSDNSDDRQYATELLNNSNEDEHTSFLIELLMDMDPKVRNSAIKTAQKKYNREVLNVLVENLSYSAYSIQAGNTLTFIGEEALGVLDSAFYKSGQSYQVMLKIIQIIGRIGGETARSLLWSKIDFPDKLLMSQVLLALGLTEFKADVTQIPRIKYGIESDIEDIAWNICAITEVTTDQFGREIKLALEEEIKYDVEHIYMLLSMLYDTKSIQLVKQNIESGTSEGITYAIELLDVFLSEDLKQRIIPVLDDLNFAEKARKLEFYFPRQKLDSKLVLKFLLNRDFAQTNRWTKACIIFQIGLLKISEFTYDLIANLFNPDGLIREIAAWSLYEIDPALYIDNVKRIGKTKQRELDELILMSTSSRRSWRSLKFEKIIFLRNIPVFKGIFGLTIAGVADAIEEMQLIEGEPLKVDELYNDNFYIVYSGTINIYEDGKLKEEVKTGEFIGELITRYKGVGNTYMRAEKDTVLFKIKKDNFYELLADNISLADKIVEYV
ncbi:cyclic nucleotide-binding domain-containing protein [Fulvivirga maritima]|uniref:cyclic nucleotide-binding domain-containing protein n=1 Tax=Fulvivirga maritima TaxID=2904247 RepID=UPI001F24185A|nr:cyclic nucleotide-binding domain-containing protein [Fulvivirga maritima]UII25234.1 cyclic nucleotide-binding domain-containing protein [Fulvivirga maritima]